MLIIPTLKNGGAEHVVARLSSSFVQVEHTVHVIEFFGTQNGYTVPSEVFRHKLCDDESEYQKLNQFKKIELLRKTIQEIDPDVIIPFLNHVCQKTIIATIGTRYRKKIIITLRNSPYEYSMLKRIFRDIFIILSKFVVVQTNDQKKYFSKLNRKNIIVIPNPVEAPITAHVYRENIIHIIACGRLIEQKNYEMMLKAFEKAKHEVNIDLKIYGIGEQESQISKLIQELRIENYVRMCGFCPDMENEYRKADLFIMTSNFEGMPNALMEAMAEGLPCISTDCKTGPSDLIRSGENGILVETNDVAMLTKNIILLVKDPKYANTLGIKARKTIQKNYQCEIIATKWIQAFHNFHLID